MSTRSGWQVWRDPVLIGVISIVGLLAALFSDGFGDWLSWLALLVPVAVSLRFLLPAPPSRS